jgi:hypothetical protein
MQALPEDGDITLVGKERIENGTALLPYRGSDCGEREHGHANHPRLEGGWQHRNLIDPFGGQSWLWIYWHENCKDAAFSRTRLR